MPRTRPQRNRTRPVRELLGDIFVLSYDNDAGYPFRVAGTRVSALLGRDLKDVGFSTLFAPDARPRDRGRHQLRRRGNAGRDRRITATAADGRTAHLELLLLPFNNRAHAPVSLTGSLAPFEDDLRHAPHFRLTSWRYLHRPKADAPRVAQARDRAWLHGV